MILLIDNYDSFTYNLVHLVGEVQPDICVKRNDKISVDDALGLKPEAIILSPGPCTPNEAGICLDLVKASSAHNIPLLGVCLGHQSIAQAFGAKIVRAKKLMHGKTSTITHDSTGLFKGVPSSFTATRYHSLVVESASITPDIISLASSDEDQLIMALQIKDKPIYGLQFHPESIATEYGVQLIQNFLNLTKVNGQ